MSVSSASTSSSNATTTEPLFFSRNMIHIAFETIVLSIMSYYFYRKTSTLSNEIKVMEAKISQLELTVKEQKTFINEKISEMVSLVTSQISRSSFPSQLHRQVYQNYQPTPPQPHIVTQSLPSMNIPQTQTHQNPPLPQTPQTPLNPVVTQTTQNPLVIPTPQNPPTPLVTQTPQNEIFQNSLFVQPHDMSIVVMEVMSSLTPKNEKSHQISVIDDNDETINMDDELSEELSELK